MKYFIILKMEGKFPSGSECNTIEIPESDYDFLIDKYVNKYTNKKFATFNIRRGEPDLTGLEDFSSGAYEK